MLPLVEVLQEFEGRDSPQSHHLLTLCSGQFFSLWCPRKKSPGLPSDDDCCIICKFCDVSWVQRAMRHATHYLQVGLQKKITWHFLKCAKTHNVWNINHHRVTGVVTPAVSVLHWVQLSINNTFKMGINPAYLIHIFLCCHVVIHVMKCGNMPLNHLIFREL